MKVQTVKKIIKGSYSNGKIPINGYEVNNKLSGKRAQVYYNPATKEAIVSHRGTASLKDWATNTGMLFGYEGGRRFQHAKKIQKRAEKLYGAENVTTVGHSLGGRIAEKVGGNTKKVITYNKAATPRSILNPTKRNQTDIRTTQDVVSYLSKFQKKQGPTISIKTNVNPLAAHSTKPLNLIKKQNV